MKTCCVLLMVICVAYAELPLPSYLKICAKDDPDFDGCTRRHAQDGLQYIVEGDRKYKIPVLDPLRITEVKITQGSGFNVRMYDVDITGLKDSTVQKAQFDLKNSKMDFLLSVPKIYLKGKYEISGRILVLPIKGNGDFSLTLDNSLAKFYGNFSVENNFVNSVNAAYEVTPSKVHFHFDNLFGGDKLLGKQMNDFINENWREVTKEFLPTYVDIVGKIVVDTVKSVLTEVPFNVIFPDTLK